MGGANPSSDSGSADAPTTTRSKVTKYRGEGGAVDFIKKGGITGAVIRGVVKAAKAIKQDFKTRKTNESLLGSSDYQGGKTFSSSRVNTGGNNDRGDNDNPILSTNTEATKQVASSGIVTSTGMVAPTTAEVSQANATNAVEPSASYSSNATLLANNKKGRKSTILQKAKGLGDSNLNTTKRTLGA